MYFSCLFDKYPSNIHQITYHKIAGKRNEQFKLKQKMEQIKKLVDWIPRQAGRGFVILSIVRLDLIVMRESRWWVGFARFWRQGRFRLVFGFHLAEILLLRIRLVFEPVVLKRLRLLILRDYVVFRLDKLLKSLLLLARLLVLRFEPHLFEFILRLARIKFQPFVSCLCVWTCNFKNSLTSKSHKSS